jgi:ribosomal protein L37AE/L43A
MKGVSVLSPARYRKACPRCHSIAVRRNKKYHKCAFCGAEFQHPLKVWVDPRVYKPFTPYKEVMMVVRKC